MDFEAAGLLEGLEGGEREARERLLRRLVDSGLSVEQLKAAIAEDRLALLPVEHVLGGELTARELEQRTGVPAELLLRIRRLDGLPPAGPDDPVYAEEDVAAAESTKLFLDAGFSEEALAQITRVLGDGMSRLAATTTAAFADTFLQPGDSEDDVAVRFSTLAEQLTPALTPVLVATFRAHLGQTVSRAVLGQAEREAGHIADAVELAVCFADVVGFTRLSGEIEAEELGFVADRLADLANDVSTGPVRLVKTIGDAAMLVSQEIAPLIEAALSLLEAAHEEDLPLLRAGVAYGRAQQRAGDFFGQPVNLASRVTGVARPGSVLCTKDVHDAGSDEFSWSFAGRYRLKGIHDPVPLYRARRLQEADSADGDATRQPADRRRRRASR